MSDNREHEVIRAFVELSNELVDDYDVVDMLSRLTTNCATLLNVASAGLLLADGRGVLHLMASSSQRTRHLELLQLQRDEGPCLDCYRNNEPVTVPDLAAEEHRWPQFVPAARERGFVSVHALPMRLRANALGTLGLFGTQPGLLTDEDLALAQALVHVACVAVVNERSASDRETINTQLQHALTSRIVVEQAKGILAHSGGLGMDEAFFVLRRYAREHGTLLSRVAADLVDRELQASTVLGYARARALITDPEPET